MNQPLVPVLCHINGRQQVSHDCFSLDIQPPPGYPGFRPGQFNMLYVPGVGEAAISISGDPNDAYRLVHTIRAVGDVTHYLQKAEDRSHIGVRGPFGGSWPLEEARGKDLVLVAGGIGMAPLRPVIYSVLDDRDAFGHVHILYGTRSPRDILFQDELMEWHRRHGITVAVTVDAARPGWTGDVGIVTRFIGRIRLDPANTIAMICGPEIMMRYTAGELLLKGLDFSQVYLAMERNMKCGTAFCGHCQLGPYFVCRDGPVFRYDDVARFMSIEQF